MINIFKIKTGIQICLNKIKWFLLDIIFLPIFWIVKLLTKKTVMENEYSFKDKDSDISGTIINFLNPIEGGGEEEKDVVVKYFSNEDNCDIFRFRNFEEIELIKIDKK